MTNNLNLHLYVQLKREQIPETLLSDTDSTENVYIMRLALLIDITYTLIG